MKKLLFTGLMLLGAFGALELTTQPAQAISCSQVRCMACPTGTVWSPIPGDCCRCLPKP
ncbi:MAG TPA: hypothetical protein VHN15_01790 [Thermoanaerobaculia bacterium]|nr:hypothetical protein [Thermoanaerobaculia bacterium]